LIPNLSTLASVYHKPPRSFLGAGRSSALQEEAIEEAKQNAKDNPIAAAAVSAAIAGTSAPPAVQSNAENLLDIDFDGAAPASMQKAPAMGSSGLEGLAGTPQRVASPAMMSPPAGQSSFGGLEDLMGLGDGPASSGPAGSNHQDLMNGFASLDMNAQQPHQQLNGDPAGKKTNEDLLGLF
jgi:hypothetical protein